VPVPCKGPFRGNLYLAERVGATEFSTADEETLTRFATAAAIAIDNADLHRRLRSLAVAEERVRIAHELHDGTAQVLAYVGVKAQTVREFLRTGRTAEAEAHLEELRAAAHNLQVETREAILSLRTKVGPDEPFAAALRHFVEHWQDQSGTPSDIVAEEDLQLEPEIKLQMLRILQEALANVRKHARASRARVELRRGEGNIAMIVEDDGVGFSTGEPLSPGHFGLSTMRERAARIGALLVIDTRPGGGTRLRVQLPDNAAFSAIRTD
jgi:signal transduction histidine kinase